MFSKAVPRRARLGSPLRCGSRPGTSNRADAPGPAGQRSPQLPLAWSPRTLKARGSHLKPGNAQTGNPLPPKQFLARRMRGAQLKQNDPHLLISSVVTKRLAIYAATLDKDIWLFPGKQVHFCMAEIREEASLSPASRPLGIRLLPDSGFHPGSGSVPLATDLRALTRLPAGALPEASKGNTTELWAGVLGLECPRKVCTGPRTRSIQAMGKGQGHQVCSKWDNFGGLSR